MVFSSLFFLFVFFIANYIAQALMPDIRKKNIVMLSFSLVFYSCAGLGCLLLMLGLTGICWGSALLISRRKIQREKKNVLIGCVVLVLLILGIFKYTGFFLQNFQALFGVPEQIPTIILPIGISFYTFQLLSYVIDVYRGDAEVQEKYWLLLLYASLFHQCIAGPIVRYRDVAEQLDRRDYTADRFGDGVFLVLRQFVPAAGPASFEVYGRSLAEKDADGLRVEREGLSGSGLAGYLDALVGDVGDAPERGDDVHQAERLGRLGCHGRAEVGVSLHRRVPC